MSEREHEHVWVRLDDEYVFCAACGEDAFDEDPGFDGIPQVVERTEEGS